MKKIFLIIILVTLCCSCASTKKTKSVTNVELESLRKKDSLSELSILELKKQVETLKSEKSKLETSLTEKAKEETNTNKEIKLKAEIDPLTGKYKQSEYNETTNGVVTKSISINGNGEVLVRENSTNSKESESVKRETFEKEFQEKFTASEKNFNQVLSIKVSEIENLKAQIRKKEKEVKSSGSSFWLGFKIGALSVVIIIIILCLINKKLSIFTITKNRTT